MRRLGWIVFGVVGILLLGGVAFYVWRVGLDDADKLGSVIGAVCGAASLTLGIAQFARSDRTDSRPAPKTINYVGENEGQVTQAETVTGTIDMRRRG